MVCGSWASAVVRSGGHLERIGGIGEQARPRPRYIAFAIAKGDRAELIVQKLTEIGADRITPMVTERTVVRLDEQHAAKRDERWRRVVREATMQSRRVWLPVLDPVTSFETVAARPGACLAVLDGGDPVTAGIGPILIGPEGGWSDSERLRPLCRVSLGEQVLRTETAAVVSCALAVDARRRNVAE
ncbi:MAG: RsmE family RNA methyltransferase [Ilumatobacteraceae bacterium]